ncbi:MAG: hypothetical protein ACE14M_00115 [Terriglobales bacterium]
MRNPRSAILFPLVIVALIAAAQIADAQKLSTRGADRVSAAPAELLAKIVSHMEEAQLQNRSTYRAYTLTREYRFYGAEDDKPPSSEVLADISFVPPDKKTFKIEQSRGSSRGRNVVQKLLESESKAAAQRKVPGTITRDNYGFTLLGEDLLQGHPCWILALNPRREEKDLVRGRVWVDKDSYLVHRIEGDMAKTPSWWLKRVAVVLEFGNAGGMWLKTGTRAVADVRIFGQHTLVEQAVKIQTADQVAQVVPASAHVSPLPGGTALRIGKNTEAPGTHGYALVGRQPTPLPAQPAPSFPAVFGSGVLTDP